MAYTIIAIDGAVILEDSDSVVSLPTNQYRCNFIKGDNDKIDVVASDNQQNNKIERIQDVADVTSIDDNRTGGAGSIAVPGTLRGIYDIINPFFFRKLGTLTPADKPWLKVDGSKQPGASDITDAFEYDDTTGKLISTDGVNYHEYHNYLQQAADSGYTNPKDHTAVIGPNTVYNDGLGVYPQSLKHQLHDPSDGYYENYSIVASNTAWDYFSDDLLYVDDGPNPEAYRSLGVGGVNSQGDYSAGLSMGPNATSLQMIVVDALGNDVTANMNMTPQGGRNGYQHIEDDGVEVLESSFDSFGTDSVLGERMSRAYYVASGDLARQVEFRDDKFELLRQESGYNIDQQLTQYGHEFGGDISLKYSVSDTFDGTQEDDYTIATLDRASLLRVNCSSNTTITGIEAPSPAKGKFLILRNVGASNNITVSNNDAGSLAANRFLLNNNIVMQPGEAVIFIYSPIDSRWEAVSDF